MEIVHEIISMVILHFLLIQEGLLSVTYKQKFVHKVLVISLVKLAQEKSVVRRTVHLNMTIAVEYDIKPQPNKQCLQKLQHTDIQYMLL